MTKNNWMDSIIVPKGTMAPLENIKDQVENKMFQGKSIWSLKCDIDLNADN